MLSEEKKNWNSCTWRVAAFSWDILGSYRESLSDHRGLVIIIEALRDVTVNENRIIPADVIQGAQLAHIW